MITDAITIAVAAGAHAENILVRGDSAYCAGGIVTAVAAEHLHYRYRASLAEAG